jgi:4-amino-4-deoxy-L-arabinose transferase-like glycosyltransferase
MSIASRWIKGMTGRSDDRPAYARGITVAALLALFFGLYFLGLGQPALLDPDEPVYGHVGREMLVTGNWLTPHRNGQLWFDKPPLFHWAVASSQALFGPTALACRLPSALTACLMALLVYGFARRLLSPRAGLYAAAAIATCLQTIILARAAVTDLLFGTCFAAACFAFYLWQEGALSPHRDAPLPSPGGPPASRRLAWAAAGGAALGLATLTKGPVAPALVGAIVVLFLAWEKRLGRLFSGGAFLAAGTCLLLAGPWYGAMLVLHPREFTEGFLVANNLVRFAHPEHPELSTPLLYFVPVLLLGLFPWTPFLIAGVRGATRSAVGRFLLVWLAVVFAFFSLSQTKLVTYIYPLYPAAACLIGRFLADTELRWREARTTGAPRSATPLRWATGAVFALALTLAIVVVTMAAQKYRSALPAATLVGLLLAVGSGTGFWLQRPGGRRGGERGGTRVPSPVSGAVAVYSGMMLLFVPLFFGLAGPIVEQRESTRSLAEWARRNGNPPVLGFRTTSPSFEFYMGRGIEREELPQSLRRRVEADSRLCILTSEKSVSVANQALAPRRLEIVARAGQRLLARPVITE